MTQDYRVDKEKRKWFIIEPFFREIPRVVNRNSGEIYVAKDLDLIGIANAVMDIHEALPLKDNNGVPNRLHFYSYKKDIQTRTILEFCDYLEKQRDNKITLSDALQTKENQIKGAIKYLSY